MKERLVELIKKSRKYCNHTDCGNCGRAKFGGFPDCKDIQLADYLLENGVIVPPCKVGDRLYQIVKMPKHTFVSEFPIIAEPQQIIYRNIMGAYSCIPFDDFGKTVFLTRAEAEAKLKEGADNDRK